MAPPPTTVALPDEPRVQAGWSLRAGDYLVSNEQGVVVVRDGAVVSNPQPVTSPVESAFADESGDIIFLTPDPDRYPSEWPHRDHGGGNTLWRLHPDGTLELVLRADGSEGPNGALSIWQVENFGFEDFPSYRSTPILTTDEVGSDLVWLAPTHPPTQWPRPYPPHQPETWDIAGAGWLDGPPGGLLFVAIHSGGDHWLERWTLYIGVSPWNTNPIPRETPCSDDPTVTDCLGTVTAMGGPLIAYTETDSRHTITDLVIYNTDFGDEVRRFRVAESPVFVKSIHASATRVVVSLIEMVDGEYRYLPATVIDNTVVNLTVVSTVVVPGVATIVP